MLTDGVPRFHITVERVERDTSTVLDSVEVDLHTFTNDTSVIDHQPYMSRGGYNYIYNYMNGKWVPGKLLGAIVH